jgi:hypothetical protein
MSGEEWNGFPEGQMSPKRCTTANHSRRFHSHGNFLTISEECLKRRSSQQFTFLYELEEVM